jgi:hypothetical protein
MQRKLRAALISLVDALAELSIDELQETLGSGYLHMDIVGTLEQRHPAKMREYDAKWRWEAIVKRNRLRGAQKAAATRRARAALT